MAAEGGLVLAVVGGRGFDDRATLFKTLNAIHFDRDGVWPHSAPKRGIARIVSGGAPGADTLAALYAERRLLPLTVFRPKWRHGRAAGMLRNTQIVEAADMVVAYWDGKSSGTKDTIKKAKSAGKLLCIIRY